MPFPKMPGLSVGPSPNVGQKMIGMKRPALGSKSVMRPRLAKPKIGLPHVKSLGYPKIKL